VLEKGRRFGAEDFPRSNWTCPAGCGCQALGFRGIFKMTFLRHVTVLSGVGVGGGSLVYANTLPTTERRILHLAFLGTSGRLEGRTGAALRRRRCACSGPAYPHETYSDQVLREIAKDIGPARPVRARAGWRSTLAARQGSARRPRCEGTGPYLAASNAGPA